MIMFQSKIGKFKFKSNLSPVYTQSFLKVFKARCLHLKISLYTNLPYAYLFTYPPLLRLHNYMNQKVFSKVVMGL